MKTDESVRGHRILPIVSRLQVRRKNLGTGLMHARTTGTPERAGRTTLSPAAQVMWRLIAAGTEPGRARGLLKAWPGWEYISHQMWPTTDIPGAPYGLLSMRVNTYTGEPVTLPGGILIATDTLVGEIHCNNQAMLRVSVSGRVSPFAACREDLRAIAAWATRDQLGRQILALNGMTILARGATRMGFSVRETPITLRRRFERMFMTGLLLLYAPDGLARLRRGRTVGTYPQEIWITRQELLKRYGDREPRLIISRARRDVAESVNGADI
ncbi:MAG: YkoP family protein [Candidatus Binataceae bacterium]